MKRGFNTVFKVSCYFNRNSRFALWSILLPQIANVANEAAENGSRLGLCGIWAF